MSTPSVAIGSLELTSADGMTRVAFAGPGPSITVTVASRDLAASIAISEESENPAIAPPTLKAFFKDLADRWMDDPGSIAYESSDGRLRMRCEWDGRGHFHLRIALQSIVIVDEPIWTLETRVELETSMLPRLATVAAAVL